VWELYNRVEGVGLEEYFREIETRAAISRIAKSKNKPKDWSKRQKDLEELIRRVYVQTAVELSSSTGPKPRTSLAHQAILGTLTAGSTILTFNYDLVIEEAFTSAHMWNPRDGYGATLPGLTLEWARLWLQSRGSPKPGKSKLLLLKLHGSLGWGSYPNRIVKLKGRPYYVRRNKYEGISVLPPGWNKRIHVNPYKQFWREARLRLEGCESLLIVGYSLPETDLLAKALFSEVVRMRAVRRAYLKQLVLVDPNSEVRAKFVKLFTPALGPQGRIVQFADIYDLPGLNAAT
jgi:hypothetical protein